MTKPEDQQASGRTFTVSEVAARANADRQWLQRWSDAGVLLPEPGTQAAGRGAHRRFSLQEVVVASVLAALAHSGVPVGQLARVAEIVRAGFFQAPRAGWTGEAPYFDALMKAQAGLPVWLLLAAEGYERNRSYSVGVVNAPTETAVSSIEIEGRGVSEFDAIFMLPLHELVRGVIAQ